MNKATFETIKASLEERVNACKVHLDHIITTEDLKNITVSEAQELKAWAKQESDIMTEIVMVDFYHIIGMGELTVTQTNLFIKLIKEYMSYRSDLKTIGTHLSLDNLPNLPSVSEFTLKRLGDVTLTSKVRGRTKAASVIIENESVKDYQKACQDLSINTVHENKTCGEFKIEDNIITFPLTVLNDLIKTINPSLSRGKITSAASYQNNAGKDYANIFWQYTNEEHTEIKAIISKANGYFAGIKNKLEKRFTK